MQNTNLRITHAHFKQHAIGRLMLRGMYFSDAVEIMHIIWPERRLPDDWENPFYDPTRALLEDTTLNHPRYHLPIW